MTTDATTSPLGQGLEAVHDDPAMQRSAALNRHIMQLTRTMQTIKSHVAATASDGVSWATYILLLHLTTGGPQRAKALAEAVCVDPSTVSRQVDQLVKLGLVERQADPSDGRATVLAATPEGYAVHRRMHERRDAMLTGVMREWEAADVVQLTDLLGRLVGDLTKALPGIVSSIDARPGNPLEWSSAPALHPSSVISPSVPKDLV